MRRPLIIIFLVLLVDQVSKFWVKLNMHLGEEFNVLGNWFIIHFVENPGMAFGMELGGDYGKIFLSIFRILAVIGLLYYIRVLIKEKAPKGVITSFALITAGALGNIIDSAFYGMIFSSSYHSVATLFPAEGGYAPFLFGKVVDMLYFPIIDGTFPEWLPLFGGEDFLFFRPVFNIADTAITVGVLMLIIFHRSYYMEDKKQPREEVNQEETETVKD